MQKQTIRDETHYLDEQQLANRNRITTLSTEHG